MLHNLFLYAGEESFLTGIVKAILDKLLWMQAATGVFQPNVVRNINHFLYSALHSTNVALIQEVYDGEYSQQCFAMELERALDIGCQIIVIEPTQLGDETARWISVGNCLHKTAVASGLGAIVTGLVWREKPFVCSPLAVFSLLCTGLYTASWQFDNCVKYQVKT